MAVNCLLHVLAAVFAGKRPRVGQMAEGWIRPMAYLDVLEKSPLPQPRTESRLLGHSTVDTTPKILSKTSESDRMVGTGVMTV